MNNDRLIKELPKPVANVINLVTVITCIINYK
jgi:hypothetical protein